MVRLLVGVLLAVGYSVVDSVGRPRARRVPAVGPKQAAAFDRLTQPNRTLRPKSLTKQAVFRALQLLRNSRSRSAVRMQLVERYAWYALVAANVPLVLINIFFETS
jgi:hypothetical protein